MQPKTPFQGLPRLTGASPAVRTIGRSRAATDSWQGRGWKPARCALTMPSLPISRRRGAQRSIKPKLI